MKCVGREGSSLPNDALVDRKKFADLKFVCNYIEEAAVSQGMDASDRSTRNVRMMYEKVETLLLEGNSNRRGTQLKWTTVINKLRKKLAAEKQSVNPT